MQKKKETIINLNKHQNMKKLFTIVCLVIAMAFTSNLKAQETPFALNATTGYSWLNGVLGLEAQFGKFAVSGGWMPCRMPIYGEWISSYSGALTYYTLAADDPGLSYYLSGGFASAGYRYEDSWGGEYTYPITIIMVGSKYDLGGFNCKAGVGYGWCEYAGAFTFEITLGFTIAGN